MKACKIGRELLDYRQLFTEREGVKKALEKYSEHLPRHPRKDETSGSERREEERKKVFGPRWGSLFKEAPKLAVEELMEGCSLFFDARPLLKSAGACGAAIIVKSFKMSGRKMPRAT